MPDILQFPRVSKQVRVDEYRNGEIVALEVGDIIVDGDWWTEMGSSGKIEITGDPDRSFRYIHVENPEIDQQHISKKP